MSKRTLQYYRERGKIPYTNIGKKCYYKTEDIRALLEKGSTGKNK
ncbi:MULTISPECIES: helix-turn-helix domain-containing protein [Rikenellaceae]|nr:helix-turn-helix domain-containing protein [Tidjanibacter massiliensis]